MPSIASIVANTKGENAESTSTSVNGSTATVDTAATEISSNGTGVVATGQAEQELPQKPASAPPKVNPWKVRTGSTSTPKTNASESQDENGSMGPPKTITRPAKAATNTVIEDVTSWPTLDKAAEEHHETHHKRPSDAGEREPMTASKSGKEKWTKITPTLIHNPLPSKSASGRGGSSTKPGRGASSARSSREKTPTDDSRRFSDAGKTHQSKPRSMSASNSRNERTSRGPQSRSDAPSHARSHSTKRSDHGSVSAPSGTTPISDASKSPTASNGFDGESRPHRASYDASMSSRPGRGAYRGRAGYQNTNFQAPSNANYQNPNHPQRAPRYRDPYGYEYPVMNPGLVPMMMDPMLARQMVLNQCEYYFSIENLCKDLFLRKHMDAEGFVNLPILAKFNRLRAITMDYALIRDVCAMSTLIELRVQSGQYDKIRTIEGWEQWVLAESERDPSTTMVPTSAEVPVDEESADTGRNIAAPSFVPGQSTPASQTTTLTENFQNLGLLQ